MRYTCPRCENWVKDKFIFGLLHICITDEELAEKERIKSFVRHGGQVSNLGIDWELYRKGQLNNDRP